MNRTPSSHPGASTGGLARSRARRRALGVMVALLGAITVVGVDASPAAAGERQWADASEGGPLATRASHAAVRLDDGRVLVTGGHEGEFSSHTAELYDPDEKKGERWSRTDDMLYNRVGHRAVNLSDRDGGTSRVMVADSYYPNPAEIYDPMAPEGDRWSEPPEPPIAHVTGPFQVLEGPQCDENAAPEWCGTVLARGLTENFNPAAAIFDPDAADGDGEWRTAAAPSQAYDDREWVRLGGAPCREDDFPEWCGTILAASGETAEVFDPKAGVSVDEDGTAVVGQWRRTRTFVNPREFHSLVGLANGDVIAVGGEDALQEERVAATELYRPEEDALPDDGEWVPPVGVWEVTGELDDPRVRQTATFVPAQGDDDDRGTVVVVGGSGEDETRCGLASVEVFDPAEGEFEPGPVVAQARKRHTATGLADGGVLVVGGESSSCGWGSAERYFPDAPVQTPTVTSVTPDAALTQGGTQVRIRGERFAYGDVVASRVQFGEVEAEEVTVHSYQEITATVPARPAATVPVRVETPKGGLSSAEDANAAFRIVQRAGVWSPVGDLESTPGHSGVQAVSLGDGTVLAAYEAEGEAHAVRYDPMADSLATVTTPPVRPEVLATVGDGGALVASGGQAAVYDPQAEAEEDEWTEPMQAPQFKSNNNYAVGLADGRVLLVTGRQSHLYDPASETWTDTAGQPDDDIGHKSGATLTALGDGLALLAGGGADGRTWAQLFDSDLLGPGEGGGWTRADMAKPRRDHAATRLGAGRAMVAGGVSVGLPGVELFDAQPDDGDSPEWAAAFQMTYPRVHHELTRLVDGSVLTVGGEGHGASIFKEDEDVAVAEVWDPATSRWQPTDSTGAAATEPAAATIRDGCDSRCGHVVAFGGDGESAVERYVPRPRVVGVDAPTAEPGEQVTIRGFGFAGVNEVAFGEHAVTEFSVDGLAGGPESPGTITTTIPGDASGQVAVTVTRQVDTGEGSVELVSALSDASLLQLPEDEGGDGDDSGGDGDDSGDGGGGSDDDIADEVGQVDDLTGTAVSATELELSWSAVADGTGGVADEYVVAQSLEPITTPEEFEAAFELCGGVCAFEPAPQTTDDTLTLTVGDLQPGTTYHYAVAPVDGDGARGPIGSSVAVTTDEGSAGENDPASDDGQQQPAGDGDESSEPAADDGEATETTGATVRVSGSDRIATALAASEEAFEAGQAGAAVLARADVFADGLAGVPLAAAENGPLLLTHSTGLDERVAAELDRAVADGGQVFLLGGQAALTDEVVQRVSELGLEPVRLAGADRFATAAAIAEQGLGAPDRVLVATGDSFADAVTAGAAAARADAAVLLSAGDQLPQPTAAYLDQHQPAQRYAVGGPAAEAVGRAEALVGATRYETAAAVADAFFPEPTTAGLATGLRFPDALSGGAHIARYGGPMLLSGSDRLHPAAGDYLAANAATITTSVVYGGPAALGQPIAEAASAAISEGS